jgi:hypothetical protein
VFQKRNSIDLGMEARVAGWRATGSPSYRELISFRHSETLTSLSLVVLMDFGWGFVV